MSAGRRFGHAAALLLCAAVLASLVGCGGSDSESGSSGGDGTTTTTATKAGAKHRKRAATGAPMPLTGSYRGPVPILMYHVVTAPKPGTTLPELWVPYETFKATMAELKDAGYAGVTLDAVWKAWRGTGPGLPPHPVVVSFDDGYLSQYQHARPTLRKLGWPGVLNIEGKNIDPSEGLSRHQIQGMIDDGWEVDSHTMTHPDLTTVGDEQLKTELVASKKLIEKLFKVPVNFLCYPAGANDARVQAAAKAAGYLGATTVEPGIASKDDNPFALPRVRVNGTDTAASVLQRLKDLGA